MTNKIILEGCAPKPLAFYLKALGILRLVSEQVDVTAKGYWQGTAFVLETALNKDQLCDFFLNKYSPTSITAGWNGGSGFYPKDNKLAINAILSSEDERFSNYKESIAVVQRCLEKLDLGEKPTDDDKQNLLLLCRNEMSEDALGWLDACFVLTNDKAKFPPLLGTGGNDGRLEFTNNFMQRVVEAFSDKEQSLPLLKNALFGETVASLSASAAVGQFFPLATGGANATSGFDSKSVVNIWDFILIMEGAIMFGAASVKRLESVQDGQLASPFCVRSSDVGYLSGASEDEKDARAEMWMPLWKAPATSEELQALFQEGRAVVGKRQVKSGVDFVRAVHSLGVDRGIEAFQRYGFLKRNGKAYFATPLERILVVHNPDVSILEEIDEWLEKFRREVTKDTAPASLKQALNNLERVIFEFCCGKAKAYDLLIALGKCEKALARSRKWAKDNFVEPLGLRQKKWIDVTYDGSTEFRLAAALMNVGSESTQTDSVTTCRSLFEPVGYRFHGAYWLEHYDDVLWHDGSIVDLLRKIFQWRILFAQKHGLSGAGLEARFETRLDDIAAFIAGKINEQKFKDLLWGLCIFDYGQMYQKPKFLFEEKSKGNVVPAFYSLLKLCFARESEVDEQLGLGYKAEEFKRRLEDRLFEEYKCPVKLVPEIFYRAVSGDSAKASKLASQRLRISDMTPVVDEIEVSSALCKRAAAALIFPISSYSYNWLRKHILKRTAEFDAEQSVKKDNTL